MFYDRLLAAGFIFIIFLFINRFKVAECIQAGGKKAKLFCNFWFAGGLCANCKCAWTCAGACSNLSVYFLYFSVRFIVSAVRYLKLSVDLSKVVVNVLKLSVDNIKTAVVILTTAVYLSIK
ncbi:MAG: hypothetical protein AB7D46_06715 [Flavobacteriaceae bacterium]